MADAAIVQNNATVPHDTVKRILKILSEDDQLAKVVTKDPKGRPCIKIGLQDEDDNEQTCLIVYLDDFGSLQDFLNTPDLELPRNLDGVPINYIMPGVMDQSR